MTNFFNWLDSLDWTAPHVWVIYLITAMFIYGILSSIINAARDAYANYTNTTKRNLRWQHDSGVTPDIFQAPDLPVVNAQGFVMCKDCGGQPRMYSINNAQVEGVFHVCSNNEMWDSGTGMCPNPNMYLTRKAWNDYHER